MTNNRSKRIPPRSGTPASRATTGTSPTRSRARRCRQGDWDRPSPAGPEDRWLPGGIVGQTDDMVVIRGMNLYPSAIEEAVRQVTAEEGMGRRLSNAVRMMLETGTVSLEEL